MSIMPGPALGSGMTMVIIAIAITRLPLGGAIGKKMAYIETACRIGASCARIMLRHIPPQCVAPSFIMATTHLAVAIIVEALLGLSRRGHSPADPDLGQHAGRHAEFGH